MPKPDVEDMLEQEAFVRSLARSLMAGEADDIVQQTYLHALTCGPGTVDRPRPWLARIVRNIVSNRRRTEERRADRERAVAKSELVPSSDELMEREQRRSILVHAVDRLPDHLRTVVLLRFFEGHPPRVVAGELNLPVSVVKERLRSAIDRLRKVLSKERGDLHAWLIPLATIVPIPPSVTPANPTKLLVTSSTLGVVAMTSKAKLVAVAVLLVVALTVMVSMLILQGGKVDGGGGQTNALAALADKAEVEQSSEKVAAPVRRESVPLPVAAEEEGSLSVAAEEEGSLSVRVVYGEDMSPAANLTLVVMRPGDDDWLVLRRVKTDVNGKAEFKSLAVGSIKLRSPRTGKHVIVDIRAGEESEVELVLRPGLMVSGIVVDIDGIPVAGAKLFFALPTRAMCEIATTGPDGQFALRACFTECVVGARADGYSPSNVHGLLGKANSSKEIRLVLPGVGGGAEGLVSGPGGQPLPGAIVCIGDGLIDTVDVGPDGYARPVLRKTDSSGRFCVLGLPLGKHPVVVRAEGFGSWMGSCSVSAGSTTTVHVSLAKGVTLRGYVRDESGKAVGGALIQAGERFKLNYLSTRSNPDGSFRLSDLPVGRVRIVTWHRILGKASIDLDVAAGTTIDRVIVFRRGLELRGRVVDAAGKPVKASVSAFAERTDKEPAWRSNTETDSTGSFAVLSCPKGRLLTVRVHGGATIDLTRNGVDPRDGVLELRAQRAAQPNESTLMVGLVVTPLGEPIANATIGLRGKQQLGGPPLTAAFLMTDAEGRFQIKAVPGRYRIEARADGYPQLLSAWRELALDTTLDFGELRMVRGGRVRLEFTQVEEELPKFFYIRDLSGAIHGVIRRGVRPLRSGPLAPGTYQVYPKSAGFAEYAVEFVVRAGEETRVQMRVRKN